MVENYYEKTFKQKQVQKVLNDINEKKMTGANDRTGIKNVIVFCFKIPNSL